MTGWHQIAGWSSGRRSAVSGRGPRPGDGGGPRPGEAWISSKRGVGRRQGSAWIGGKRGVDQRQESAWVSGKMQLPSNRRHHPRGCQYVVVAAESQGGHSRVSADWSAHRKVARDPAYAVGEEAWGEHVRGNRNAAPTRACTIKDDTEPLTSPGDIPDLHRTIDALSKHRSSGRAVKQSPPVRRPSSCHHNPIDPSQISAIKQPIHQNISQQRIRPQRRRSLHLIRPTLSLARDIDRRVIPTAKQQRHHHSMVAISNHSVNQRRQRRHIHIHKPQRHRHRRPSSSHQPDQLMDLTNAPRIRSSMGRRHQVDHVAAPTGSTANRYPRRTTVRTNSGRPTAVRNLFTVTSTA